MDQNTRETWNTSDLLRYFGLGQMTSAELWGQNSLVGPFFPYQDRHWKTARHEKIEASELKPSEEKKSIMVWSLSNLTTEIRPGKHLENPTKNGSIPETNRIFPQQHWSIACKPLMVGIFGSALSDDYLNSGVATVRSPSTTKLGGLLVTFL